MRLTPSQAVSSPVARRLRAKRAVLASSSQKAWFVKPQAPRNTAHVSAATQSIASRSGQAEFVQAGSSDDSLPVFSMGPWTSSQLFSLTQRCLSA